MYNYINVSSGTYGPCTPLTPQRTPLDPHPLLVIGSLAISCSLSFMFCCADNSFYSVIVIYQEKIVPVMTEEKTLHIIREREKVDIFIED